MNLEIILVPYSGFLTIFFIGRKCQGFTGQRRKVDAGDIFSLLLAIGAESVVAYTLLSQGKELPVEAAHPFHF